MRTITLTVACLAGLVIPCLAEDGPSSSSGPPKPPSYDLSRPVTLTGAEIQALVRAAVLQAQAQDAARAAAEADAKFRAAVTVPESGKADNDQVKP